MKYDKEMSESELEDAIKANEQQIKKSTRKLGAEKVTCYLLKHADLSIVPDYKNIRDNVLATYAEDKQPDFQNDLSEKAEKRVRTILSKIDYLEKQNTLYEEKLNSIRHTLDDYKQDIPAEETE